MFIRDKEHTVVNTVRDARTALKITQDELADSVQATRQTIIAIEKGNYVPSVLLALRIAANNIGYCAAGRHRFDNLGGRNAQNNHHAFACRNGTVNRCFVFVGCVFNFNLARESSG
jgi:putative transcriptional regulator